MGPKTRNKSKAQLEVDKALGTSSSDQDSPKASIAEKIRRKAAKRQADDSVSRAGPSHRGNVSDSSRVIEKSIVVNDGVSVDLADLLDRALERRLPRSILRRLSGDRDPVTKVHGSSELSQTGTSRQNKVPHEPPPPHILSESEESFQEQDSDSDVEELIGAGAFHSRAREVADASDGYAASRPFDISQSLDLSSSNTTVAHSDSPAAEVDPDLPPPKKPKVNFNPGHLVVDWARAHFANPPSVKDQINHLEEQHVPDESTEDLFSPIKQSDLILKGMLNKENKDNDTIYFDRHKTEKHLYMSQYLLGLSYAPFMDALTQLANVPNSGKARKLIGDGILAVASARNEISFARRELCRKMVRSDIAPYLYSNKPTNTQLFGGESIEAQAKLAKDASKNNIDIVYKKPKTPKPQNKGFHKGPAKNQQTSGKSSRQGQAKNRRKSKAKNKQQSNPSAAAETPDNQ